MTSQKLCKACLLIEGLNTGNTDLGVRKSKKSKKVTVEADELNKEGGCGSGGGGGGCGCAGAEDAAENEETRQRLKDLQF